MSEPEKSPLAEALRGALSRDKRIAAWQFRRVRSSGRQAYLVKTQLESERSTQRETCETTVFVKNGDLLGRSSITLGVADVSAVSKRIDEAVYMAGLGGDAPWTLPGAGEWPRVEARDTSLTGDKTLATSRSLIEAWRTEVAAHPEVRPSSMELFCGEDTVTLENSAGLVASASGTRVSLLTMLLADGARAAERYSWDERRRVSDLDIRAIVRRAAEEAHDLTRAELPPSGQYSVVIDADEIPNFLEPVQANSSAEGLYEKVSRFELGKALPIEDKGGEPLNLYSNAVAPYGLSSYVFDGDGVAGQRVEIVKDNAFSHAWATKQYADYLKTQPTGGFANWEIPAGKTALGDLTAGDGRVLYVRSFSWLTPDAARGSFASEVRVGYLYEKGTRKPVKGGTVSGNVFTALGTARYAKDGVFLGEYMGPAAVRFEGLTVAGA